MSRISRLTFALEHVNKNMDQSSSVLFSDLPSFLLIRCDVELKCGFDVGRDILMDLFKRSAGMRVFVHTISDDMVWTS